MAILIGILTFIMVLIAAFLINGKEACMSQCFQMKRKICWRYIECRTNLARDHAFMAFLDK